MSSLRKALCLGVYLSAWMMTAADGDAPKAENVRWLSLDFKTLLLWTATPSNYTFTVGYSWDDSDWMRSPNCIQIAETECDLSKELEPLRRTFIADIQTEPDKMTHYEVEDLPHTYSPPFNPYGQSEISAANFTVEMVEEGKVSVTIQDPLTSFHKYGKQLSIRDIFKSDLQYKISYYKSGNTGKRDIIFASNRGEVSGLDGGHSYCFMVAAFIPSRDKAYQQGAWSIQQCTPGHKNAFQDLSLGALVGGLFILAIVLVVIVAVTVVCCRRRARSSRTYQSSSVV
ncbi:tissue factor-like isoform X1 [Hippocampus comes]|uniref:Tissue factor n=1 Tax=Hippocampus comes TaxID=109280 RepID=A0A3Q3DXT0_HIPCM|nr:PREDICTED: tissue factor-like isoform X1 [Hippocampus comes]XP_019739352.1 PREDICTED: tissue factor-like isoform X1 [Hippocampus comes]